MSERVGAAASLRSRFAFNQATAKYWPLPDAVAGCVAAGVTNIGLWREPVAEYGLDATNALLRETGLSVTSLCRGGFFTTDGWYDDNRRAIDEAAALGTPVLVLVSGGLPAGSRDIDGARERVADAIGQLAPHAAACGVTLAIEPLHPMFASDRCVIVTLGQALDIAERFDAGTVGVTVDTYHLWWDDQALTQIGRAGERVAIFQIADWATPLPAGVLTGRVMPGDGCVQQRRYLDAVTAAGYAGPIEVEIFNEEIWARPGAETLQRAIDGYLETLR
ncbi:MAG: sugar phosphate isomerase/epimerase [Dactylosporangium sp.]|nr:sugar phosphate isomerase/epimerase [Dactylosporangium sp.]NNJ59832.1 sugar phosphate isomerase/epimerase [Dactylosporangium sp.]